MSDTGNNTGIHTGIYRHFTPQEIQTAVNQMNESAYCRGVGCDMLMEHVQYMVAKSEQTK